MIRAVLFITFFKIGLFTFGGGYAMLPLIQSEVIAHGWLGMDELINFIAVSESTPGPFAVNISTYIGMVTGGPAGAACATLGVILPSFIIILMVAKFYDRFRESRLVSGAMTGLRPTVVGLIAAAILSVGQDVFFPDGFVSSVGLYISIGIFLLVSFLAFRKKHPIFLIGLSALLGILAGYGLNL
ncbi:MAG: chromate transporter [Eubacterium sp.]|nr:chromate transporter [Eubacterium sp.]